MAKNNWLAGEKLTKIKLNQPFYLSSGVVSGGVARVFVSGGSLRYPTRNFLTASGNEQPWSVSFNSQAGYYYQIHVRPQGTFAISGTSTMAGEKPPFKASVMFPPKHDAELIGAVWINDSNTAMTGPWMIGVTTPAGEGTATYGNASQRSGISMASGWVFEGRGQYVAATAGRPHIVTVPIAQGSVIGTSGVAYCSENFAHGVTWSDYVLLFATVKYLISGSAGRNLIYDTRLKYWSDVLIKDVTDRRYLPNNSDPFTATYDETVLTNITVAPVSSGGYKLTMYASHDVVVVGGELTVVAGFRGPWASLA